MIKQILRAFCLPKEMVTILMMLHRNTKAMVYSLDSNTDFFEIIAGVLQRDTLAPYAVIIRLDYI